MLKSNTPLTKSLWRKVLQISQLNVRSERSSSRKFGRITLKNKTKTTLTLFVVTSKVIAEVAVQPTVMPFKELPEFKEAIHLELFKEFKELLTAVFQEYKALCKELQASREAAPS